MIAILNFPVLISTVEWQILIMKHQLQRRDTPCPRWVPVCQCAPLHPTICTLPCTPHLLILHHPHTYSLFTI